MRKLFLLLLIAWWGGQRTSRAQENFVANPGFEGASAKDGLPGGGWWLSQSVGETSVKVDRSVAHTGEASARMTAPSEEKCVLVCRKFDVAPGDGLRFEAWVRGSNLPANRTGTFAGLAFRGTDGKVLARHYIASGALGAEWSLITGTAVAPPEAASAEVHLAYTNAPGTVWYDDVVAVITNALSLSLVDTAKPWPGAQEITVRVTNRQTNEFRGRISAQAGAVTKSVPVTLAPRAAKNFKLPITLTGVGQHSYDIILLDAHGAPVKVVQGKFKTLPPLALYPPCPSYLPLGSDDREVQLDALVNIDPALRAGLKLSVTVLDAEGHEQQSKNTAVSLGAVTGLKVSIPVSTAGVFSVAARLMDRKGREVAAAQQQVHIIAPAEAQVRIGLDGFLRVAGQPEFPIGLYSSSRNPELAQAGFNATHNYNVSTGEAGDEINSTDMQLEELLDKAWASGMRMMVELPRKAIEKGEWTQVRRRIETFRYHPGLLCWGSEERVARGATTPDHIAALYALVHKLDPDHPLVLGDSSDVIQKLMVDRRDFFPNQSMDIGIWWWYPIPIKAGKSDALAGQEEEADTMEPPTWLTTTHSKKPLWIAIQSYQKSSRNARFPTPAEYRCEAYLSIINGVKGLFFYCGTGQKDYYGKSAGVLNKPELGHWEYVKQLAGELRDFSPVILAPPAAGKLELTPAKGAVEYSTRELGGKIYLIAANKSSQPQKARWQGELLRGRKAETLFEDHPVKVEGDTLADDFPAYAVHVYKFE